MHMQPWSCPLARRAPPGSLLPCFTLEIHPHPHTAPATLTDQSPPNRSMAKQDNTFMNSAVNTFDPPASEGGEATHREPACSLPCLRLARMALCGIGMLRSPCTVRPAADSRPCLQCCQLPPLLTRTFSALGPLGRPAAAVGHQASAARVCGAAPRADGSGGREGQLVPA